MGYVLASSVLAPWGEAAAIILALSLIASVIGGLVLTMVLMFGFSWLREKSELLKTLRSTVNEVNRGMVASKEGQPLPREVADNKMVQVVARVPRVAATLPARASDIDQKVEHSSDRVAEAVIEFHARTEMAKGIVKAFFLPGLTRPRSSAPVEIATALEREQVSVSSERVSEEGPPEQEITIVQSWQ